MVPFREGWGFNRSGTRRDFVRTVATVVAIAGCGRQSSPGSGGLIGEASDLEADPRQIAVIREDLHRLLTSIRAAVNDENFFSNLLSSDSARALAELEDFCVQKVRLETETISRACFRFLTEARGNSTRVMDVFLPYGVYNFLLAISEVP